MVDVAKLDFEKIRAHRLALVGVEGVAEGRIRSRLRLTFGDLINAPNVAIPRMTFGNWL
jgi:hypothetical protein